MNPAERVEQPAVVSVDMGADHLRAGALGEPLSGRFPLRLTTSALERGPVRDFAGRKHDQRAAPSQPLAGRAQTGETARGDGGMRGGVDKEAELMQFGNSREQV